MKRQLLAFACATLFGCSIASAADLAVRKAPPPPAPISSWTGFYIGAHVGTGWGTTESEFSDIALRISQTSTNGFLGGVQVGYNLQLSPAVVIGVEGDFSGTSIKGTSPCFVVVSCSTDHDWVATLAGRFGVTYDRALFYVKGGVAGRRQRTPPLSEASPRASTKPASARCSGLASSTPSSRAGRRRSSTTTSTSERTTSAFRSGVDRSTSPFKRQRIL